MTELSEGRFIVTQRDNAWSFSHRGDPAGPFKTRQEAIDAAIAEACNLGNPGAQVIVQDHDLTQETVWRYPGD
jgi:hypothetical protein